MGQLGALAHADGATAAAHAAAGTDGRELDREWLVGEVESLAASGAHPVRRSDVESALAEPPGLVLLVPDIEREVVLDLDASRDRMLEAPRNQPIVLFLIRGGDGQRALAADAMSLASWVAGSDADPDALARVDPTAEREAFRRDLGTTPERWLEGWRSGSRSRTSENEWVVSQLVPTGSFEPAPWTDVEAALERSPES